MTVTTGHTDNTDAGQRNGRARPAPPGAAEVAPAPKLRRRPILVVASVAAVCLGALLGVWAWTATSNTHEVVAVRATIVRGETIDQADLMTVQVGVDPGLRTVAGSSLPDLVGQRAAMDMAAGSLVTAESVTRSVIPPAGKSVVGVALPPSLMPGEPLQSGDHVRIVATPGAQGEATDGPPVEVTATVVGLHPGAEQDKTVVSVLVPKDEAGELAARAATGRVALVLDSRER